MFKTLKRRLSGRPAPAAPEDSRGRRVVAVIECLLNQNARDAGAACSPAMAGSVVDLCREHQVGLVQLPCPEMACLGLQRRRAAGQSIRQALQTPACQQASAEIATQATDRLQAYAEAGFKLLAVLGGNPQSPGCAVCADGDGQMAPEAGLLMRQLQADLQRRGMQVPFLGMRDSDAALLGSDLKRLQQIFKTDAACDSGSAVPCSTAAP